MTLYSYPEDFAENKSPLSCGCVIALGFFDGVHIAHRALLREGKAAAEALGVPFGVFTFLSEAAELKTDSLRIYSTEEKLDLLADAGADFAVLCNFRSISSFSAEEFIEKILCGSFCARAVICGFNYRFGRGAAGDSGFLKSELEKRNIRCMVSGEVKLHGKTLSSSLIRALISDGKMEQAAEALGLPYFTRGRVMHGKGFGHTIGIPTLNISFTEGKIYPPHGVYESAVLIDGSLYPALTNVGVCPTFGDESPHAETYILNFDRDVYDSQVTVYYLKFLREEIKFPSKDALLKQIDADKARVLCGTPEEKWQKIGLK